MTGPVGEHVYFDELAAGYALNALEPREAIRFREHLPTCPRCEGSVRDFLEVAATLADAGSSGQPDHQLGERIRAATAGPAAAGPPAAAAKAGSDAGGGWTAAAPPAGPAAAPPPEAGRPAGVSYLRQRRRPLLAAAAAAAAGVALAGGVTWIRTAGAGSAQRPPAACVRTHQCYQVQLTDSRSSSGEVARVIVAHGTAWVQPAGLAADRADRQVYVLWQISGSRTPEAVGSFDVRPGASGKIRVGRLALPYQNTWAFGVSLETGRTIPARPSRPMAFGQVPG